MARTLSLPGRTVIQRLSLSGPVPRMALRPGPRPRRNDGTGGRGGGGRFGTLASPPQWSSQECSSPCQGEGRQFKSGLGRKRNAWSGGVKETEPPSNKDQVLMEC
jgi:hypothetical protein